MQDFEKSKLGDDILTLLSCSVGHGKSPKVKGLANKSQDEARARVWMQQVVRSPNLHQLCVRDWILAFSFSSLNQISEIYFLSSVQFSSVTQSCLTPCDPMDGSMPGFPVHHQLLELAQTHVHRVGDAIQPSHPLSSPSSPAFNLSQHRGLFQWVSSSQKGPKVLEFQLQHQSRLTCYLFLSNKSPLVIIFGNSF